MTATNIFFISRRRVALKSIGSRSVFRIRTKATFLADATRAEVICGAEATLGLFLTKPFKVAQKNDHTPRRFRCNWPNGASNCTARRAYRRCLIHFLESEIQRSLRSTAA